MDSGWNAGGVMLSGCMHDNSPVVYVHNSPVVYVAHSLVQDQLFGTHYLRTCVLQCA